MHLFDRLISLLIVPLIALRLLAGIVGAIWLVTLGEWRTILSGLALLIGGTLMLRVTMMPSALLAAHAAVSGQRGDASGFTRYGVLSGLCTTALFAAWCIALLYLFAHPLPLRSLMPRLLLSFCIAIAPLAWQAQRVGPDCGDNIALSLTAVQIGYIAAVIAALVGNNEWRCMMVLGAVALAGVVVHVWRVFQLAAAQPQRQPSRGR